MTADKAQRQRAFLVALRALTIKHGIAVAGCGCCGSPSLEPVDVSDSMAGYVYRDRLLWVSPADELDWGEYSAEVVRDNKVTP